MERYDEYKDSGVEWIGEMPTHWAIKRMRFLYSFRSGMANKKPEDFGEGFPFLTYKDVYKSDSVNDPTGLVKSTITDQEKYSVLRGDVFFTGSSETIDELGFSSVCLSDLPNCTFNGFTIRARPISEDLAPEYCKYLFRSQVVRGFLTQSDNSITRANLSQQTLSDMNVIIPPFDEQVLISVYLNIKTAEIDSLIEKTERSIELLEEYRKSIISEAVTKGLDPNVPMKDSGIEWIGEIPAHWQAPRLKHIAKIESGATPNREQAIYWNGDIPWIKTGELQNGTTTNSEERISQIALTETSVKLFAKGTVLVAMYGQGKTRGMTSLLEIDACTNQACAGVQPNGELVSSKYLQYFIIASYDAIRLTAQGSGQPNLSLDLIANWVTCLPPLLEQARIAVEIEKRIKAINDNIENKRMLVNLYSEYRKSLISEAVTGKFKVSGVE